MQYALNRVSYAALTLALFATLSALGSLAAQGTSDDASLTAERGLATSVTQEHSSDSDPFAARELEVLRLKSHAHYVAAFAAASDLLDDMTKDGVHAEDTVAGALRAARAEFVATITTLLAHRIGAFDATQELLRDMIARPFTDSHPSLHDVCAHAALEVAHNSGDDESAAAWTRDLGYIGEWMLIGPFDNERGGGFAQAYGPEQEIDLAARYDGKKRSVGWRSAPLSHPVGGRFDCDSMFRPNDQVLCYAATVIIAEHAADVTLSLGSDEAVKVFLNGREEFARDVRRRFAADQDCVPLRLRAGANVLLLKVCDQTGPFAFAARLRNADGSPLDGRVVASPSIAPTDFATARAAAVAFEPDPTAPAVVRRPRGLDVLADSARAGHARDAYRLGMLLGLSHPDDPSDRRDQEFARQAVAALPDDPHAHYLLAFSRVQQGKSEELDENPRRHDYETVLALDPDHAEARRSLAEIELQSAGTPMRALEQIDLALAVEPAFAAARLLRASALEALDLDSLADAELARAAQAVDADHPEWRSPQALPRHFSKLTDRNRWRDAAAFGPTLLKSNTGHRALLSVARTALRTGDRTRGVALLERAIARFPFEREPRRRLARLFEAELDFDGALRMLDGWLAVCPEDDDILVDLARVHGRRGDTERQVEALREAVDLNPNRERERRRLEFLLGDVTPFFADFAIADDPDLFETPSPEDAATENDPFYYLLEHDVLRAYRNGTTSHYHHRVVRILSEQGARQLATYSVPHSWGDQTARLLEVRVVRADGSELEPRFRGSYVRMPPLAIGDCCEIRYRVDDRAPSFFGDYFGYQHSFAARDGSASRRAVLDLILESGRSYRMQRKNGAPEAIATVEVEDGSTIYRFEMRDLARRALEPRRPKLAEAEPMLRVTTYGDWNEFSAWWWNLIRKQSSMTPAMRTKVEKLTAGLETEVAKIDAIYRFVTTEVRYKAWEFGVHGYQPYTTPVIFERRHGDCKDKALLLNVMLAEVGIDAFPVLIHADPVRSQDDLELAMVQHFNHCISYLPARGDRAEMFLDGTASYHPLETLPEMDQGADVLVVQPESGATEFIPWTTAEANRDARNYDVRLEADGSALVTLVHTPTGNQAVRIREALGNEPAKRDERIERDLTSRFGSVEILQVNTSDLLDLQQAVRVEVEFRCLELAQQETGAAGDGLKLAAGLAPRSMQGWTTAPERQFALLLGPPSSTTQVVRYHLPDGYELAARGADSIPADVTLDTAFSAFRSAWSREADGTLRLERSRALRQHRIEPAEYAEFRNYAAEVDSADNRVLVIRRKDS